MTLAIREYAAPRRPQRLPDSHPHLRQGPARYPFSSSVGRFGREPTRSTGPTSAADLLALQRTVGNSAVGGLVERSSLALGWSPRTGTPFARSPVGDLQRQADGPPPTGSKFPCPVPPKDNDPRCIADEARLTAAFWTERGGAQLIADGGRLHEAFHNSPPLKEKRKEPEPEAAVELFKAALKEAPTPANVTPKLIKEGVKGWDKSTHDRVFQFQENNGIQPGGFEAGRKTLLALDGHLRALTPKKPTAVTAECGQGDNAGIAVVHGDGFPPGFVELLLANAPSQFAKVDANKHFDANVGLGGRTGKQDITVKDSTGQSRTVEVDCKGATPPTPSGTNPELEATLNRLDFAIHHLILRQRDGVQALQSDLRSIDPKKPGPGRQAFVFGLNMVLSFSYGLAEFGLRNHFKKNYDGELSTADPLSRDVFDNGFDKMYDQGFQAGSEKVVDFVANLVFDNPKDESTRRQAKANDFAQAQLGLVTGAGFEMADDFEKTTKPALRRATGPVPVKGSEKDVGPNTLGDPRQTRALLLLKSMERLVQSAFQEHYDAAMGAWASTLAGEQVKTTADPSKLTERLVPDPDDPGRMKLVAVSGRTVTDLKGAADKEDIPGVLEVVLGTTQESPIHFIHPDSPLRIESARISGMSAEARRKLTQQHKTIAGMPLPVVARDNGKFALDDNSDEEPVQVEAQVQVGINEAGTPFNLSKNAEGHRWLRIKGGLQRMVDTVKALRIPRVEEGGK